MKKEMLVWIVIFAVGLSTYLALKTRDSQEPKELKNYIALCGDKQYKLQASSWERENNGQCFRFYDQNNQVSSFVCHCYLISEVEEKK